MLESDGVPDEVVEQWRPPGDIARKNAGLSVSRHPIGVRCTAAPPAPAPFSYFLSDVRGPSFHSFSRSCSRIGICKGLGLAWNFLGSKILIRIKLSKIETKFQAKCFFSDKISFSNFEMLLDFYFLTILFLKFDNESSELHKSEVHFSLSKFIFRLSSLNSLKGDRYGWNYFFPKKVIALAKIL